MPDQSGTPRSQDWNSYYRLSPTERRKIPTRSHKNRRKRIDGIGTGELVQIQHANGTVRGHATPYRNRVSIGAKPARTAYISTATLIARHHGYATTAIPWQLKTECRHALACPDCRQTFCPSCYPPDQWSNDHKPHCPHCTETNP